jgi:hypothetical protein
MTLPIIFTAIWRSDEAGGTKTQGQLKTQEQADERGQTEKARALRRTQERPTTAAACENHAAH